MTLTRHIAPDEIEQELTDEIERVNALLEELKLIKVNTSHSKLTNRALEGAKLINNIYANELWDKEIIVFYRSGTRVHGEHIRAYTIEGERRLLTPLELQNEIERIYDRNAIYVNELISARLNVQELASEHNRLVDLIDAHNDKVPSCARSAKLYN